MLFIHLNLSISIFCTMLILAGLLNLRGFVKKEISPNIFSTIFLLQEELKIYENKIVFHLILHRQFLQRTCFLNTTIDWFLTACQPIEGYLMSEDLRVTFIVHSCFFV